MRRRRLSATICSRVLLSSRHHLLSQTDAGVAAKKHAMQRLLPLVGLLCCILALWSAADRHVVVDAWAAPDTALSAQRLRVLFIGNSYTYFNNLPEMLATLAQSAPHARTLDTAIVAKGAATLQQLWTEGEAVAAIRNGSWDYVVLQEQSTLGATLIDGQTAINAPQFFYTYARLFDREITAQGGKTVFLLTWARKRALAHQAALTSAYMRIAQELHAVVVPVGMAWQKLREAKPDLELYAKDGSHPSPLGSYVAACLFYATLFGESPEGVPAQVVAHAVSPGGRLAETTTTLVDLPPEEATWLQRFVWQTYTELHAVGGYVSVEAPNPPARPALQVERQPTVDELVGIWRGPLKFYAAPTVMELRLSRDGEHWKAERQVTVGEGAAVQTLVAPLLDFAVQDGELTFTVQDHRGVGWRERYRGVWTGHSLMGTAEMGSALSPPCLLGSWELQRQP